MTEDRDITLSLSIIDMFHLDAALSERIKQGEAIIQEGFDIREDVDKLIALRERMRVAAGISETNS